VKVKRLIRERIRRSGPGINLVADVNADISVNVRQGAPAPDRSRTDRTSTPSSLRAERTSDQRDEEDR
jgi:hypothetical protein